MTAFAEAPLRTLIDDLLDEQQRLSAVERFALKHERHALPAQARYYRELIPLTKPQAGEQYAFAVDLDACTGCKACVSACHALNGLEEDEIWRNVGLIHGGTIAEPYVQTVTTACHHCVEPACLEGCPVRAYEKDEDTGIVRHLDDQCIGCQYCVLKCPYDVPKYSRRKGIVRKCDMCYNRLAVDEAPACVQACPTSAISIRIVTKKQLVASLAAGDRLLPGAFDSGYTTPATTYTTRRAMPSNTRPGDAPALRLEHAHWPLIWMLLLTQVAAGMIAGAALLAVVSPSNFEIVQAPLAASAFAILNVGLAVSVLHLGRPLGAWRAFLGFRTSWMSREILAFSTFAAAAGAFTVAALWPSAVTMLPWLGALSAILKPTGVAAPLAIITSTLAALGVFCSAMIYIDTRRAFWSASLVFTKFFGTALLLGSAGCAAALGWQHVLTGAPVADTAWIFALAATIIRTALFGWEAMNLRHGLADLSEPTRRSHLTVWHLSRRFVFARAALIVGSTLFGVLAITHGGFYAAICATISFAPPSRPRPSNGISSSPPSSRRACPEESRHECDLFARVEIGKHEMNKLIARLKPLVRQWTGPLTEDLIQSPGDFGLGKIPARLTPDDTTTIVCGFCSTGCGLNVHLKDGRAINLSADTHYPVNLGMACPKGWEALTPLAAPDRATTPLLRNDRGEFEPIDWERALVLFCERFKEIKAKHGPESVAVLSTGQIVTEEMAFLGGLFKFGMGFIHADSNTRQCMATAHVAYKQSFGFDAPPYTYADFEESDVLVFVGSNLCIAHPIMWQRVMRNKHRPEIIVVDPRKTETAMAATQHYAIRPKSDLTLLYGLANMLIASHWIRRDYIDAHSTGFDEFAEFVTRFTPDMVSDATGISVEQLWRFAQTIADGKRVSFWWTMGVNQGHESTRTAQAIINLALMTGNIGRPGTGANSITGQCNAMGSRLFANATSLLGGHDFTNDADRAKVAGILGIDETCIPRESSLAYDQIVQGIADGKIKGLWVVATNGSHSWIDQNEYNELMGKLDFLVVQDMYPTTETAQRADLVLPAAGWGEKEGTFINSERRIGLVKKVAHAPGQALSDFNIFKLIAHYWGCGAMFARWTSPEAAFGLMKELSRGQPCDITGIADYRMIDECGGVQWPLREVGSRKSEVGSEGEAIHAPATERRLFEDGRFFTPDGRARFIFEDPRPVAEPVDADFPFVLLTGRGTSSQWHTQTRTGKSDVLRHLYPPNIYLEINPLDAERLGIAEQAKVRVRSRRAEIVATAFVTATVQPGQLFLPMHYAAVNQLTFPSFDPHSRQPSYKACAVAVEALP